jgi:hypothetical protein
MTKIQMTKTKKPQEMGFQDKFVVKVPPVSQGAFYEGAKIADQLEE